MKLNLYNINDRYIKYLRQFEEKIYENKEKSRKHNRKYLGIVLIINEFNYYIPMSSPKKSDYIDISNKIIKYSNIVYSQKIKNLDIGYIKNVNNFKILEEKMKLWKSFLY